MELIVVTLLLRLPQLERLYMVIDMPRRHALLPPRHRSRPLMPSTMDLSLLDCRRSSTHAVMPRQCRIRRSPNQDASIQHAVGARSHLGS